MSEMRTLSLDVLPSVNQRRYPLSLLIDNAQILFLQTNTCALLSLVGSIIINKACLCFNANRYNVGRTWSKM